MKFFKSESRKGNGREQLRHEEMKRDGANFLITSTIFVILFTKKTNKFHVLFLLLSTPLRIRVGE